MIAFATSALFDLKFISSNWVRYWLVVLLIVMELATGFFYIKSETQTFKQKPNA